MTDPQTQQATAGQGSILDLLTKPREGIETVFELAEALSEDGKASVGKRLVIERRKLEAETPIEKPRRESEKRAHTFLAATGFIAYLLKYGSEHTVIYADPEQRCVEAVLDETAKHGREVVTLRPQTHPRWQPWRALLGQRIPLDSFRELVTQNRKAIIKPDGRDLIFLMRQIKMSTEVTLQSGVMKGGAAAVNGLVIRTKILGSAGGEDSEQLDLPESVTIKTPVLVDEPEQEIEMDLILGGKSDGSEVYAQLASADLREAEIEAFDGLVEKMRMELGSGTDGRYTITHGRVDEQPWERLRG